jgi:hypothetical protein
MTSRLLQVSLQGIFQLRFGSCVNHLGQSFSDLGFSGVQVLQLVKIEFSETVKICGKEFHVVTSWICWI